MTCLHRFYKFSKIDKWNCGCWALEKHCIISVSHLPSRSRKRSPPVSRTNMLSKAYTAAGYLPNAYTKAHTRHTVMKVEHFAFGPGTKGVKSNIQHFRLCFSKPWNSHLFIKTVKHNTHTPPSTLWCLDQMMGQRRSGSKIKPKKHIYFFFNIFGLHSFLKQQKYSLMMLSY